MDCNIKNGQFVRSHAADFGFMPTFVLNFGKSDFDSTQKLVQSLSGGLELFGTMYYAFKKGKPYPLEDNGQFNRNGRLERIENCHFPNQQN